MNIEDLFKNEPKEENPCNGCSILKTPGEKCITQDVRECDILFVTGSYNKSKFGKISPVGFIDKQYIEEILCRYNNNPNLKIEYAAAVKCPSITERAMETADFHICRKYIEQTIKDANPKVIITLGNLAMKMVTKKSGIFSKRGTEFQIELDEKTYTVIPTLDAGHVVAEPSLKFYFDADIRNILAKYLGGAKALVSEYTYIGEIEMLEDYDWLCYTNLEVAVDIETTGFDFNNDYIQTISFTTKKGTFVIPWKHKDSPFIEDLTGVHDFVSRVLTNPNNVKIFHNSSFDVKFLMAEGIKVENVRCTAAMAHLVNEDMVKKLISLVKIYIPERLENLRC